MTVAPLGFGWANYRSLKSRGEEPLVGARSERRFTPFCAVGENAHYQRVTELTRKAQNRYLTKTSQVANVRRVEGRPERKAICTSSAGRSCWKPTGIIWGMDWRPCSMVGIGPQSQLNGRTWKKSGKPMRMLMAFL